MGKSKECLSVVYPLHLAKQYWLSWQLCVHNARNDKTPTGPGCHWCLFCSQLFQIMITVQWKMEYLPFEFCFSLASAVICYLPIYSPKLRIGAIHYSFIKYYSFPIMMTATCCCVRITRKHLKETFRGCLICSLLKGRITYAFVTSVRSHSLFGHIYPTALLGVPQQKDFPSSSDPFMLQFKLIMFSGYRTQGEQCLLFATDTYIYIWRLLCTHNLFFRFL